MTSTTDLDSAYSTGVSEPVGKYRHGHDAIGLREDTAATDTTSKWSATALLKGALVGLGLSSGTGVTMTEPRYEPDPIGAIGGRTDAATTSASAPASIPALLKGILATAGL